MKILLQDNLGSHYRSAVFRLIDKELDCDFCFGDEWEDIKKMDRSLLSHKVIEVKNRIINGKFYYQKGFLKLIRQKYDVYIVGGDTHNLSIWLLGFFTRLFYPNKRVYFWTHGWYGKESKMEKCVKKIFFKLPNGGCFLYGSHARNLMIKEGFNPDKLFVIHNSLDYDAQLPIRHELEPKSIYSEHFGNDNKNIVFIGRLTKVKRFDLLIDAVAKLKQRKELVNVTFIGDGVERQNMENMVEGKGIKDQVWFYGACYNEKTNAELIYNADLCVSPGNIGLTAMHVLMFGCPVITNNDYSHQMPEFEALQEGKTGNFFKAGDSSALAEAISRWFSVHGGDRERVRQDCYLEIDTGWNPHHQISVIKQVLGL